MNCGWRKEKQHFSSNFLPPIVIGSCLPRFVAELWRTPPAISEVGFSFFFFFGLQISDFYTLLN